MRTPSIRRAYQLAAPPQRAQAPPPSLSQITATARSETNAYTQKGTQTTNYSKQERHYLFRDNMKLSISGVQINCRRPRPDRKKLILINALRQRFATLRQLYTQTRRSKSDNSYAAKRDYLLAKKLALSSSDVPNYHKKPLL